jgi:hypothetical protein
VFQVIPINGTDYKAVQYIQDFSGQKRLEINRHGVKIFFLVGGKLFVSILIFQQETMMRSDFLCIFSLNWLISGTLKVFSMNALLIRLVTSLGLLSVANLIVDNIMQYVMPLRRWYTAYKVHRSTPLNISWFGFSPLLDMFSTPKHRG